MALNVISFLKKSVNIGLLYRVFLTLAVWGDLYTMGKCAPLGLSVIWEPHRSTGQTDRPIDAFLVCGCPLS